MTRILYSLIKQKHDADPVLRQEIIDSGDKKNS